MHTHTNNQSLEQTMISSATQILQLTHKRFTPGSSCEVTNVAYARQTVAAQCEVVSLCTSDRQYTLCAVHTLVSLTGKPNCHWLRGRSR